MRAGMEMAMIRSFVYGVLNTNAYLVWQGADAVLALVGGDIDAVIIDNQPAKVFVEQNAGLEILPTEYAVEEYAIAVKKGNTELLDQINGALEALIADGTVDAIVAKYISAN